MSIRSTYTPRHARPAVKRFGHRTLCAVTALALAVGLMVQSNTANAATVTAGVIETALAQTGTPYQYGAAPWTVASASTTKCAATHKCTFDCSSLVQYSFERHGIPVPRTTGGQWMAGKKIALNSVMPGDIVFFSDANKTVAGITHVAILIGNGKMAEAPHAGANVRVTTWRDRPGLMPYAVRLI